MHDTNRNPVVFYLIIEYCPINGLVFCQYYFFNTKFIRLAKNFLIH